ncbi:MAG: lipoyl(octanoyl) transferase LipB [Gammaproteobacteria bacterium]|nr:lipoyl(octanoyl) transferase LipB [Gammaproteobacteria bacterium]MCY4357362.1 lipoyl(octanoyl) transferase LipB [Gammaproteobacteria bacterium]
MLSDYKSFIATPANPDLPKLVVRRLGLQDYEPIFKTMRYLAEHRKAGRSDEIWLLSHKPVFTQGQAGKAEHILNPGEIPVVQVDRGGQVTYHGPGQLVAYLLLDVRRRRLGVRNLVDAIERAVIKTLSEFEIEANTRQGAPGVYVNGAKIAALGLRIKQGLSYHGLSLNVNMDLEPFSRINPCGFERLSVTQIADFVQLRQPMLQQTSKVMVDNLLTELGYLTCYN